MKILVTGANGYLGRGIVKALLDKGADVTATDFMTEGIDRRAKQYEADLFSMEEPYAFFGGPDVLLHLAWRNGFVHNDESHIADLHKHYGFLDKMISSGIERVAVMGSMHEVGFFEGSIKAETPVYKRTESVGFYRLWRILQTGLRSRPAGQAVGHYQCMFRISRKTGGSGRKVYL